MRLFKFVRSASAVLNMAKGSLKFTPIAELNDPSELTPVMDRPAVRASLEALRRKGFTKRQFKWLQHQEATLHLLAPEEKVLNAPTTLADANRMLRISTYDNLDHMEAKLFAAVALIKDRVGILSLSKRYDSLPMWAHYADMGKGFVVILENVEQAFRGDETGSLNVAKRVVYTKQFAGMTFDPSTQDRLFFSKLTDWSYEREWRVVTALRGCRRESALYLRDVTSNHLTGVICGWRASVEDCSSLRDELKRLNPEVALISAALSAGRITLAPPIR